VLNKTLTIISTHFDDLGADQASEFHYPFILSHSFIADKSGISLDCPGSEFQYDSKGAVALVEKLLAETCYRQQNCQSSCAKVGSVSVECNYARFGILSLGINQSKPKAQSGPSARSTEVSAR
jgi:hypothetical protein